ncbi:hypothetical protein AMECASPLE_031321 [Ameca splendens]|uniref:Uncharacterized protein n=1 Tax=Ameca splendens TaxID=208324 RepID=A0ABV0XJC1_9TELE
MSVSAPYKYAIASVRSHRPAPLDLGHIQRIFQAIDIQRLPRAQEPQEIHRWDYRNHPREEQGRVLREPSSSHSAEAQGAPATSPQAPHQPSTPEQIQPWTQRPETLGHITHQAEARQSPGVQALASSHQK